MPIILTMLIVAGLVYGVASLIISQVRPESEPISTITITRNTPSASELNLSAPLVDYHPNKDECQEEKLTDEETDEERDKRLAACKEKKEKEEKEKSESEVADGETTEVLGEQDEKLPFMEMMARVIGASAAKSNSSKSDTKLDDTEKTDLSGSATGSTDSGENKVDNSVGENTNN